MAFYNCVLCGTPHSLEEYAKAEKLFNQLSDAEMITLLKREVWCQERGTSYPVMDIVCMFKPVAICPTCVHELSLYVKHHTKPLAPVVSQQRNYRWGL